MRKLGRYLRELDVFPKLDPSAPRVKTSSSGFVSIVCFIMLGYLFFQEIVDYGNPIVASGVSVDTSRMEMGYLNISLAIEFPSMPCSFFGIDAVDHLGHKVVDATVEGGLSKHTWHNDESGTDEEGCLLEGYFAVRKIRGQFQLASRRQIDLFPSMNYIVHGEGPSQHLHAQDLNSIEDKLKFNVTHRIRMLSFGMPVPGVELPLNGVRHVMPDDKYLKITYFIQVIPSQFHYANGHTVESYRYSVTEHKEEELPRAGSTSLSSIRWSYDFSPYTTKYQEQSKSFTHFLTRCCAVIGGTYVVFGLLSALAARAEVAAKKEK